MLGIRRTFTYAVVLLLLADVCAVSAEPPPQCEDRASRRAALLLSPSKFNSLKDKDRWLVVDVRPESAYQEFRIPGSIRLFPAQLKHADVLKGRKIVLVGEGYRDAVLEREAESLEGVTEVRLLDGGIQGWWSSKLPLDGTIARARDVNKISIGDFYADAGAGGWNVVFISDKPGDKVTGVPIPVERTFSIASKKLRAEIFDFMKKSPAKVGTLLVTGSAKSEKKAMALLGDRFPAKTFLLEGGRQAFARQPANLTAGLVRQSSGGCRKN